jgi:hypothetical protein
MSPRMGGVVGANLVAPDGHHDHPRPLRFRDCGQLGVVAVDRAYPQGGDGMGPSRVRKEALVLMLVAYCPVSAAPSPL